MLHFLLPTPSPPETPLSQLASVSQACHPSHLFSLLRALKYFHNFSYLKKKKNPSTQHRTFPYYVSSFKYWNTFVLALLTTHNLVFQLQPGGQHPRPPERANSAQGHQELLLSNPSDIGCAFGFRYSRVWIPAPPKPFDLLRLPGFKPHFSLCKCFIRRLSWWLSGQVRLMNCAQVLTNMLPFTKRSLP